MGLLILKLIAINIIQDTTSTISVELHPPSHPLQLYIAYLLIHLRVIFCLYLPLLAHFGSETQHKGDQYQACQNPQQLAINQLPSDALFAVLLFVFFLLLSYLLLMSIFLIYLVVQYLSIAFYELNLVKIHTVFV